MYNQEELTNFCLEVCRDMANKEAKTRTVTVAFTMNRDIIKGAIVAVNASQSTCRLQFDDGAGPYGGHYSGIDFFKN